MASTLEELEAIRAKYRNLQKEWDNQQEHLGRLQGDMFKLRSQLKTQSSFCASLGAIMGSLMWKTTKVPDVVDALLSTNRVSEFMCIVSGSLESFMDTYSTNLPDVTTNEMQFILSLVGIVANMAANVEGRQFLITDPNGRELIDRMIQMLPEIPEFSGDCLKRVVMMTLYNISINQLGLVMLLERRSLFEELSKGIVTETNPELMVLALRLLQSFTMQIPSSQIYNEITSAVPMDKIQELTNTTDADLRLLAKNVVGNLERADKKFGSTVPSTYMGWNKCHRSPGGGKSSCSVLETKSMGSPEDDLNQICQKILKNQT